MSEIHSGIVAHIKTCMDNNLTRSLWLRENNDKQGDTDKCYHIKHIFTIYTRVK